MQDKPPAYIRANARGKKGVKYTAFWAEENTEPGYFLFRHTTVVKLPYSKVLHLHICVYIKRECRGETEKVEKAKYTEITEESWQVRWLLWTASTSILRLHWVESRRNSGCIGRSRAKQEDLPEHFEFWVRTYVNEPEWERRREPESHHQLPQHQSLPEWPSC